VDLTDLTPVEALLVAGACVVLGLLILAAIAERPRRLPRPDPVKLRAAAQALADYAGDAHAVAGRAAAAAIEARERLAEAERARDEAWRAQEAAGAAHQEALYGRPAPAERDPATVDLELIAAGEVGGPHGDRQRDISRTALSADHQRAEDLAARRGYERAALVARQAAEALRVAEMEARAMAAEAMAAAAEAHEAMRVAQRFAPKSSRKDSRKNKR
jgi:hypothetical protein